MRMETGEKKTNNCAIGVFDSGLGGLTAVKELMQRLPKENIVYFGDTGRVPYGTRSNETIIKYASQDIRFLLNFNIKLIVVACGTASSVALEQMRAQFKVPIVGVVKPAVEKAIALTRNKRIGIIGTPSTISSKSYVRSIAQIAPDVHTVDKACPLFVPLVENGYIDNQVARLVTQEYLEPLKQEQVDTLIMGCTHYPLLKDTISAVMGKSVTLVDSGAETAKYVRDILEKKSALANEASKKQYRYFVSDSVKHFEEIGSLFLQKEIQNCVDKVDIEQY